MIDINKKYITKDGREVRIYATDGSGFDSVHGAILINRDEWMSRSWDKYGIYDPTKHSDNDLIEAWIPKDKEPIWCWENHYKTCRTLLFWDAVNNTIFNVHGGRNHVRYTNYAKVEHIEQWMLDMQAKLED